MPINLGVLISGRGSNMEALARYAAETANCPYRIALVISDQPAALGITRAQAFGIPALVRPRDANRGQAEQEAAVQQALDSKGCEMIALAGYMRRLSAPFLARWGAPKSRRVVNIHPSLLPAYRGLNTHARALADGAAWHGASVHLVDAEIDSGQVLAQARVPVLPQDTAAALAERVLAAEHWLYPHAVASLAQSLNAERR